MKTITISRSFFHWTHTIFIQNIVTIVKRFLTAADQKKHHQQAGGSANAQNNLPINALKRGPITYFSMSYSLHSNFYNLFDVEKTGMVFLRL